MRQRVDSPTSLCLVRGVPPGTAAARSNSGRPRSAPERILIVRLSSFGDVIQTLPLLPAIRRRHPTAKIGWVIDRELADAIEGHQYLDFIHRCDRNRWGRDFTNPLKWPRLLREIRQLAAEIDAIRYDVAIDAQGLFKSATIPYMAGIPRRVGFAHRREFTNLFYTEKIISRDDYFDPSRHHLEHMLKLLGAIGCEIGEYSLVIPPENHAAAARIDYLLTKLEATGPIVVIAPFTQWASKRWPLERWRMLAQRMLQDTNTGIVLVGASGDRASAVELTEAIGESAAGRVLNLAGLTSIGDLYALFSRVQITIAADTAPLHVAGAAGCPHLVGLFGSTSSTRTGPLGNSSKTSLSANPQMSCQPCLQRTCRYGTTECMLRISPDDVLAELKKCLDAQ